MTPLTASPLGGAAFLNALRRAAADKSSRVLTMEHSGSRLPWPSCAPAWSMLRPCAAVHTDLRGLSTPATKPLALEDVPGQVLSTLPPLHVQAVAAHARSAAELGLRLQSALRLKPAALLLVSGDSPSKTSLDTVALLQMAVSLRAELALDTVLLCAANPLLSLSTDTLARKLDAGCDGFITQPALLPSRFDAWWEVAQPALRGCPMLLGLAAPCTPSDVQLWYRLAGVDGNDADAVALLSSWRVAVDQVHPGALAAHASRSYAAAMRHAAGVPGLAGVHLMPVTAGGYALAAASQSPLAF